MQRIIDFVSGKLTYAQFETIFTEDPSIWDLAQSLLTPEIMNDSAHPFWSKSNRSRLESNNYCVQYACLSFGYDALGQVITHGMLSELVSFRYPDVVLRDPPALSSTDLREKLGMEYLGGPEVDDRIDEILRGKPADVSVSKFLTTARQELRTLFHLIPRKYPRWVQEPEWPMGSSSPMVFIGQQRDNELAAYTFQDADTGAQRTVKQFY